MKKETGTLFAGMILGIIALLGLQMFKEGNTDTITRLKTNNRKVVKKIAIPSTQSVREAVAVRSMIDSPSRLGLASNDSLIDLKPKPLPKTDIELEVDEEEITDSNNNPIAQNPLKLPRTEIGVRW